MKDLLCLIGLLVQFGSTHGSICNTDESHTITCNIVGCCGSINNEYCCDKKLLDDGTIVAIVGGILLGLLLIIIIVCIVKFSKRRVGMAAPDDRTIQSIQSTAITSSSGYPSLGYNTSVYGSYPQPPPFGQQIFGTPAYGMAHAAPSIENYGFTTADETRGQTSTKSLR